LPGDLHGKLPPVDAELGEDVGEVVLDRLEADAQVLGVDPLRLARESQRWEQGAAKQR